MYTGIGWHKVGIESRRVWLAIMRFGACSRNRTYHTEVFVTVSYRRTAQVPKTMSSRGIISTPRYADMRKRLRCSATFDTTNPVLFILFSPGAS
jgi:hypothetical protein